jgi:tetratricopeptide (TPR) repeat protein
MNPFSLMRYGVRITAWLWPRIQEARQRRAMNRTLAEQNYNNKNYAEAEKYLLLAVEEADKRRSPEKQRLHLLFLLASARRKQSKFLESRQTIGVIMQRLRASNSTVSTQYAQCLELLASMHEESGTFADALRIRTEALEIEQRVTPQDPKRIAICLKQLAAAYHSVNDLSECATKYQKAIAAHERAFGLEHAGTATCVAELGIVFQEQDKHDQAHPLLERALAVHEKTPGPHSIEVLRDLQHLGFSAQALGRVEEAMGCYEKAIQLSQRQVADRTSAVAEMMVNLARIYAGMSRLGPAQELLQQAVVSLERTPGPQLDYCLELLAAIHDRTGRTKEAAAARAMMTSNGLAQTQTA